MVSVTELGLTILAASIFWLWFRSRKDKRFNLPPGPGLALPFVGHVLQFGKCPHLKFGEWAEKFGKVFQIQMGSYRLVLISDPKLVREAFNDPNLSGRVDLDTFSILAEGKFGVINSDGPSWVEQRRFTLRHLRDFGFGKNTMESLIEVEVKEYLEFLKKNEGQSVHLQRQFNLAVLNSLWVILTGTRYKHDDPRLVDIFTQNAKISEESANSPAFLLPSVAKMFPEWSGWNGVMTLVRSMRQFCIEEIDQHQKTYEEEGTPRDFIDAYIKEIKATTNPESSFYKHVGEHSLKAVMTDFLAAGSDTTTMTLSWAVLYLCKFPEVQKKFQRELDSVVGKNRNVTISDRPNLPYTEAVILEALRMSSIVPFGVFHRALNDTKLHGFDIPKGTWIAPNQHYLHYNEQLWDQPHVFQPARFLDNDGKLSKKPEAFMPFSTGKRVCIGENLARDSVFLFLTAIFQKYEVRLADQFSKVSLDPKPGFLLAPQLYEVVVQDRM